MSLTISTLSGQQLGIDLDELDEVSEESIFNAVYPLLTEYDDKVAGPLDDGHTYTIDSVDFEGDELAELVEFWDVWSSLDGDRAEAYVSLVGYEGVNNIPSLRDFEDRFTGFSDREDFAADYLENIVEGWSSLPDIITTNIKLEDVWYDLNDSHTDIDGWIFRDQ